MKNQFTKTIMASILKPQNSFDICQKPLIIGGKNAELFFIDGFAKDEVMEKVLEFFLKITPEDIINLKDNNAEYFNMKYLPYIETSIESNPNKAADFVMAGALVLCIDDIYDYIIIDARTYPVRSVSEPENERVLRGSRDGFVETLIFNTSLLRRRIRDQNLSMELFTVGEMSKTDIVVCYMDNLADKKFVKLIKDKIKNIKIDALSMGQESLAECLFKFKWYNPFPKIRYTERPDCAAANILEGKVIVFVDNSPAVMIFPSSLFDFVQETDDYYFPPLTGTYLRLLRILIFILSLFLTPVWFLLIINPDFIPPWLDFIKISENVSLPVIVQLLILELAIDGIKLASLNTPSALGNSLSIIGGLILGEYAIKAGWFSSEVILYMAFVAMANFTQPSYEMGYAFKFMRVLCLILTAIFNLYGFIAAIIIIITLISINKTLENKSYLYPLIPFNGKKLYSLIFRLSINNNATKSGRKN